MPITNDDQIDLDRVITDPEYRRHVIIYLNAQARRLGRSPRTAAMSLGFIGPGRGIDRLTQQPMRRTG